jgi:hypothetical protein
VSPVEWVELGGALAAALFAGSKLEQVRAIRKAKREALKKAGAR